MMSRRTLLATMASTAALSSAHATPSGARIERLKTPKGIEVWLVRQSNLPIIALDWAVRGGAAFEPAEKAGLASMTAALLDEGAGDLDAEAYLKRLDDNAIQIGFSAQRDNFGGSLKTLTPARDEAFSLLRLALTKPRFDDAPSDRVRQQILSGIRRASTNPGSIASDTWWSTAFPNHPYGRRTSGTAETVGSITRADLADYAARVLRRETLKIAVVGDIAANELIERIDATFGDLPEKAVFAPIPDIVMQGAGERKVINLDVPQTVISFGSPGIKRRDPDFLGAFVANHILGGGSFTSRLYTEVREKRGLAYGVSSGLYPLDATGIFVGSTSTRNDKAAESVAIIEQEVRRMATDGPTEQELADAKRYLIGSWAMRFETSNAISGNLLRIRLDGFDPDYVEKRNTLIEAVSAEDARRGIRRLLGDGKLLVVAVGKPQGL